MSGVRRVKCIKCGRVFEASKVGERICHACSQLEKPIYRPSKLADPRPTPRTRVEPIKVEEVARMREDGFIFRRINKWKIDEARHTDEELSIWRIEHGKEALELLQSLSVYMDKCEESNIDPKLTIEHNGSLYVFTLCRDSITT